MEGSILVLTISEFLWWERFWGYILDFKETYVIKWYFGLLTKNVLTRQPVLSAELTTLFITGSQKPIPFLIKKLERWCTQLNFERWKGNFSELSHSANDIQAYITKSPLTFFYMNTLNWADVVYVKSYLRL